MAAIQTNGTSHEATSPLNIPPSSTSIDVKVIDVCSIGNVATKALFMPPVPGFDKFDGAPSFVFLLEHPSGQKLLFDLGIRKDWENLDSAIVERLKEHGYRVDVEHGIAEFLDEAGVGKESINAIIWRYVSFKSIQEGLVVGRR